MSKSELFWDLKKKKSLPAPLSDSVFHPLLIFHTSSNTLSYLVSQKQKHSSTKSLSIVNFKGLKHKLSQMRKTARE